MLSSCDCSAATHFVNPIFADHDESAARSTYYDDTTGAHDAHLESKPVQRRSSSHLTDQYSVPHKGGGYSEPGRSDALYDTAHHAGDADTQAGVVLANPTYAVAAATARLSHSHAGLPGAVDEQDTSL